MEERWCPHCKQNILHPSSQNFDKFWKFEFENRCYNCNKKLQLTPHSQSKLSWQFWKIPASYYSQYLDKKQNPIYIMNFFEKIFGKRGVSKDEHVSKGEQTPAIKLAYWREVGPNPKSKNIAFTTDYKVVKFDCATCHTENTCDDDNDTGSMVICRHCRNISYVPPHYKALSEAGLFEIYASVSVPIKEFNDWFIGHPLFLESSNFEKCNLWVYCASCRYKFESSIFHSLPGNEIFKRQIFLANSNKSAEDMQAITNGSCHKCSGSDLLALLVKLPGK